MVPYSAAFEQTCIDEAPENREAQAAKAKELGAP